MPTSQPGVPRCSPVASLEIVFFVLRVELHSHSHTTCSFNLLHAITSLMNSRCSSCCLKKSCTIHVTTGWSTARRASGLLHFGNTLVGFIAFDHAGADPVGVSLDGECGGKRRDRRGWRPDASDRGTVLHHVLHFIEQFERANPHRAQRISSSRIWFMTDQFCCRYWFSSCRHSRSPPSPAFW